MTLLFDEAKSWSLLTPYPVVFGDSCFWYGLFMSKVAAMNIAGLVFFKIGIPPSQKNEIWNSSLRHFNHYKNIVNLEYDLNKYNAESLMRYLVSTITMRNASLEKPLYTKEQFIIDFLM